MVAKIWLAGLVLLPALVYLPVRDDGALIAVLYRQPKLAVIQVLGWLFLAGFFWSIRAGLLERCRRALRRRSLFLLLVFCLWSGATGLWARVGANAVYEWSQLVMLALLAVAIVIRLDEQPSSRAWVTGGMLVGMAAATLIGFWQLRFGFPGLVPVDAGHGVLHPSTMGYKNPMALALLGQIFLLGFAVDRGWGAGAMGRPLRIVAGVLLGLEMLHLLSLQSRATYVALSLTVPLMAILLVRDSASTQARRRLMIVVGLMVALGVVLVLLLPGIGERIESVREVVDRSVFEQKGDRITYLLNSLTMARHRPLGVGLGNWQTQYPVYRFHNRDTAFNETVQVRRAHNDYAQVLGETGWLGLGLWLLVLAASVGSCVQRYGRHRDRFALFLAVQIVAVAIVMGGDYFLDLPFHKLQMVILIALAASLERVAPEVQSPTPRPKADRAGVVFLLMIALVMSAAAVALLVKSVVAVQLESALRDVGILRAERAPEALVAASIERGLRRGVRFERLPGHEKTFHKHYLILAELALLDDRRDAVRTYAEEALARHPYNVNALRLLASFYQSSDRQASERYWEAYDYILHQATTGFRRPYPEPPGPP